MPNLVYNASFKSIAAQHREKGLDWFFIKKTEGYKKEVSPDNAGLFVMSTPQGKFQVYSFNFFTAQITLVKDNIVSKEQANYWRNSNRHRYQIKL